MGPAESDRRTFLTRVGLLGALAGAAAVIPAAAGARQVLPNLSGADIDLIRTALNEVSRDTYNALTVFAVPGQDDYSAAQGTPRDEAGAIEARSPDFMLHALDNFVPLPDQLVRPVATALANGLTGVPIDLPGDLLEIGSVGEAADALIVNDEVLPLSITITLLLNFLALQVNPGSESGDLRSPFARLSYAEKAQALSLLEGADSDLVATVDGDVPEPWRSMLSGFGKYLGGALITFSAFASYSEWAVFDPGRRTVSRQPVGWAISGYDPGELDGWDDMQGYYQGRTEVAA